MGSIVVTSGGSAYGSAPSVLILGASSVQATATASLTSNAVSSTTITNAGSGYTVAPQIIFSVTSGNGGVIKIKTRTEGLTANGTLLGGTLLTRGYAAKLLAGTKDTSKYKFEFWTGTFKGLDANGEPYELVEANTQPALLCSSVEFATVSDFIDWAKQDYYFNLYFKLDSYSKYGTGALDANDLSGNTGYALAAGGSEYYASSYMDAALDSITEENNTYFLCDQWGDNGQSVNNTKILSFINNDSNFKKFMFVGGGYNDQKLLGTNSSTAIAQYYNSDRVLVVHSGIYIPVVGGFAAKDSIYHAALCLGRIAGLDAQVPGTYKDIRISGLVHVASKKQREQMTDNGVMHTFQDPQLGWVIEQSINTLQKNSVLYNADGTSYEHSIGKITAQMQREITQNAKVLFVGGNLNTASATDVYTFTKGYLESKLAKPNADNLIVDYQDITVVLNQDSWVVSFGFYPNSPINKLFFTGIILDKSISIQ